VTGVSLAAGGIVLLAATVQSAAGFGYTIIAVPLLAVVIGPAQALPVAWLTFLPLTVVMVLSLRTEVNWMIGWRLGLPGVPATLIGAWSLAHLPSRVLQALTGLSVLALTFTPAPPRAAALGERAMDLLAGALAGLLGAAAGASGPPLVLAVSRHGLDRAQTRATLAWVFTLFSLATLTWLTLTGRIPPQSRTLLPGSVPPLAAGTALGSLLGRRLPEHATASTIRVLVLVSGLVCLTKAVAA
jgi:uncharacterized protein